jgi:predicted ATP-dependent endonuclease of OLD family
MNYWIKNIAIDDSFNTYKIYNIDGVKEANLTNLAKINIFVGANNSGKSRFIRLVSSTAKIKFDLNLNIDEIESLKTNTNNKIQEFASKRAYEIQMPILTKYKFFEESSDLFKDVFNVYEQIYKSNSISIKSGYVNSNMHERDLKELRNFFSPLKEKYESIISVLPKNLSFKKLYIPALRGLRTFSIENNSKDLYKERTIKDYFIFKSDNDKVQPEIFTGLDLYKVIRDHLLGDQKERDAVVEFQDFLSKTFFENKSVVLIPRKDKDVLVVKIGDAPEYPIDQLGDGIQSIIVLTFPLFLSRYENLLVFIEEPEIYMHPGLQRIFLNTLFQFNNHQFFFTTHSNHFLDLTLDYENISIYTFNRKEEESGEGTISEIFNIHNVSNESRKTLELLGVRNSSVLLSNCTIWVEGITDRKYIAHYLKLYQDNLHADSKDCYKEDIHYSFVEYSGGNITHWSFLEGENTIYVEHLCGKLFLITDKDDSESKCKFERHEKLEEILGDRYCRLKVREIENLLTPDVLKKVISDYEKEPPDLPSFVFDDYRDELLGNYIEATLLKDKKSRLGRYADKSGTVTQKTDFCDKAIFHIKNYDDMSGEAKELSKLIYKFIKENNSK